MYLTRHSDMVTGINMAQPILVVGAGSIGSYATLSLAKLGFTNITVADAGMVDEENIAPQFYRPRDIGKLKVDCLKRAIKDQTNTDIITVPYMLDGDNLDAVKNNDNMIIMAVDSMSARKEIFDYSYYSYWVDARMAIEFLTVISYSKPPTGTYQGRSNRELYKNTLFSDDQAVQEACTNKAISYTSFIAGGLVAKCALDLLKGQTTLQTVNFDINAFDMVRLS